jgi:hypothetical protein
MSLKCKKVDLVKVEGRMVVARGWRSWGGRRYIISVRRNMKVSCLDK